MFMYKSLEKSDDLRKIKALPALTFGKPASSSATWQHGCASPPSDLAVQGWGARGCAGHQGDRPPP